MSIVLTRQQFLHTLPLLFCGGFACGGVSEGDQGARQSVDDANNPRSESGAVCVADEISDNHELGHWMNPIKLEDAASREPKSYGIQGSSYHDHTITLTPDDFAKLKAGSTVVVESSIDGGHSHTVTLTCRT